MQKNLVKIWETLPDFPCPCGYTLIDGDVSGGGIATRENVQSVTDCGDLCNDDPNCCSIKYSEMNSECIMNAECQPDPDQGPNNLYKFCKGELKTVAYLTQN